MVRIVAKAEVLNLRSRGLARSQARSVSNQPLDLSQSVRPVSRATIGKPDRPESSTSQPITTKTSDSDSEARMKTSQAVCVRREQPGQNPA